MIRNLTLSLSLVSFIFLFIQCDNTPSEKPDLIEPGIMMQTEVMEDTCSCEILTQNEDLLLNEDQPYTGVCTQKYPDTKTNYIVKHILNGKLHGSVVYYDKKGNVLVEEIYKNGVRKRAGNNAPLSCACTELESVELPGEIYPRFLLDGIPFTGKCTKNYPESDQMYLEAHYENGLTNGFTTYFDQQGNTLYIEKYEAGKLIKVIYE